MKPDKNTSRERVEHTRKAIQAIENFTRSHSLETFLKDEKTISACLYQFTIIGEATFQIDNDILEKYPYAWYRIKSFRNFILHSYHAIDMKVVWDTIRNVLPDLKILMDTIHREEF